MTIKEIYVLEEAAQDLNEGKEFYEKNEAGIGLYFWDYMVSEFESLYLYAGIHVKEFNFYKMITRRFPYAVYYDLIDNDVYIIAVIPMKRNPDWIKKRLGE